MSNYRSNSEIFVFHIGVRLPLTRSDVKPGKDLIEASVVRACERFQDMFRKGTFRFFALFPSNLSTSSQNAHCTTSE